MGRARIVVAKHKRKQRIREGSEARLFAEREAAHVTFHAQPSTPSASDSSSIRESTTWPNGALGPETPEMEKLMQAYQNSLSDKKRNESLIDILYAAAAPLFPDEDPSKADWRLERIIQDVTAALEDLNTSTTEKATTGAPQPARSALPTPPTTPETSRHRKRFQSKSEGSALRTYSQIQPKAADKAFSRLRDYRKWNGKLFSWQAWYQGLNRAYHNDCTTGLDPANSDIALLAWNAILDKLPDLVLDKLLSEGVLVPERPDPDQLLVDLDRFFGSGV